jgi:hypothetical protein
MDFKSVKTPTLERFGLYYLRLFGSKHLTHHAFDFTDEELNKKVRRITRKGILLSATVGLVCVWPTVYVDVLYQNQSFWVHYGWVAGVTLVSILIEFYLLFIIALKAVDEVSNLINIRATRNGLLEEGPFNISNILARAALELPDPEMKILGIDPFKLVSKKNLLVLGIFYKAKIFLTNFIAKYILRFTLGPTISGVSILYEALPVECFWNGVVIERVVKEARLRLFGYVLCNHIAENVLKENLIKELSPKAQMGCLRAIGNAVVMTQNYHPNMIILLLRFQQLLKIDEVDRLDDWSLFLQTLEEVTEKERNALLDIFTIAAAFDGKISRIETRNIQQAYGEDFPLYQERLLKLTDHLKNGQLNAAAALCAIDFTAG